MNKKYNLKLDLQFRCNNSKMIFDEFDENTSDFFMQITRQGEKVDISNAIPTLLVLKPSGTAVSQILNIKDNLIYGNLNNSLKNEVGTYIAKLMLVEGDKKTFISNISYEVTENALLGKIDDDIVEDERYSALLQLLERLSNIELQEQTRIDNENSRIEAENLREESIEKIKNDIDFLISETNKKVDNNLNTNNSKIDNLVIKTKEELNEYKSNKDVSIDEDLKEFKETTNKSIQDYKTSKDIEIDNILNAYKADTTNDINSFKNAVNSKIDKYKNDKDKAINEYIEAKELELDNYAEAKDREIDEYKTSKNNEIDLYISKKNTLINSKISEVDSVKEQLQNSVNSKLVEVDNAENQRQQEHEERQQFLNGFEGKLNTVVDDVAGVRDDVVSVREANKRQDVFLQGLYNENLDGRVTVKEEGSVISLTNSDNGLIDIVGLEGNTLVNYVQDGAKELTLNGDIEAEGTNVTLTEGVDNGLVDVSLEGNTLVNLIGGYKDPVSVSDVTLDKTKYTFTMPNNAPYTGATNVYVNRIKPNTQYTIIANITKNTLTKGQLLLANYEQTNFANETIRVNPNELGIKKYLVTSKNEIPAGATIRSYLLEANEGEQITIGDYILLEGDYTSKPIPPYFEGMKSVGECEDNKIEIVSYKRYISKYIEAYSAQKKPIFYIPHDSSASGVPISEFDPYKKYFNYCDGFAQCNNMFDYYSVSDGYWVYLGVWGTTYDACEKARAVMNRHIAKCEGNAKEITLSEPLRALPNGVKDKIVKIGGKWYVERNCREVTINGSTPITGYYTNGINDDMIVPYYVSQAYEVNSYALCDKLPFYKYPSDSNPIGKSESMTVGSSAGGTIFLTLKRSNFANSDLQTYLNNNPIKCIVKLVKPTYEEITNPTVNTYNDITHISNNSTIPCNMKVTNTGYNAIIKPSTQYTVAFDTDKSGEVGINLGGTKVTTTNNVATVTTPSTLTDDTLRLTGKGIKASKVILLESDKTNWIPSYFEGMKSSFEDKLQDDGTYKMEILSNNKNLCNNGNNYENWRKVNSNQQYEKIENGFILDINLNSDVNSRIAHNTKIKLKHGERYTISFDVKFLQSSVNNGIQVYMCSYKDTKSNYGHSTNSNGKFKWSFVYDEHTDIFGIYFQVENKVEHLKAEITNVQIEKGSTLTDYIKNISNKIQFSSIEPLRGVGDVKDRFVFKDGKLMIERNCKQGTILATHNLAEHGSSTDTIMLIQNWSMGGLKPKDSTAILTDSKFRNKGTWRDGYYIYPAGGTILFSVPRTDFATLNDFKVWLNENPISIVVITSEPTYEEVPFELQKIILEGYENGTLFLDTNIPPTITASYTANIPLVAKVNEVNEVTETNTEDIAITQMAVDFLLMSTLGEEILNFKVRSGYNMASYFANRIIKDALKYEDVIKKYPQYKEDISSILVSEGHSDLIIEL